MGIAGNFSFFSCTRIYILSLKSGYANHIFLASCDYWAQSLLFSFCCQELKNNSRFLDFGVTLLYFVYFRLLLIVFGNSDFWKYS